MRPHTTGFNDYIAKPASIQKFWQAIRTGQYAVPTFAADTQLTINGVSYVTETPIVNSTCTSMYKIRKANTTELYVLKLLFVPEGYYEITAQGLRTNIQQQIKKVLQLNHPNLIEVHQVGEGFELIDPENGYSYSCPDAYIVMAYADGFELCQLHESHGCVVPIKDGLSIMAAVTDVLMYLHSLNLLYRDLKMTNLIYTEERQIKLIDLCSIAWSTGCKNVFSATRCYQAPEVQAAYDANRTPYPFTVQSDIFSLGSLFLHLLSCDIRAEYTNDGVKMALRKQRKKNRNLVVCIQRMIISMIDPQPEKRIPLDRVKKRLNNYITRVN